MRLEALKQGTTVIRSGVRRKLPRSQSADSLEATPLQTFADSG